MDMWINAVVLLHVAVAVAIIGLVLLQHGKGADMGSGFGSGNSGSLFGASGSANFLSRTTAVLAAVFFASSLGLGYFATQKPKAGGASVVDALKSDAKKAASPAKAEGPAKPGAEAAPGAPAGEAAKPKDVPN